MFLYDFGAGLKEADPLQRPPPLTTTSKAVGLGSGWGPGVGTGRGVAARPEGTSPRWRFPDPGVPAGGQPEARAGARGEDHGVQCGAGPRAGAGQCLLSGGRASPPAAPEVSPSPGGRVRRAGPGGGRP